MNMNKFALMVLMSLFLFTNSVMAAEPYDRVIAVVDGEIILNSEVMTALYQLQNQPGFSGLSNDLLKKKVLDRLIDDKVIIAVSKMDSIYVTEDELNERLDQHFDQLRGAQNLTQEQLEQAIKAQLGMDFVDYRKKMGDNMRDQNILQKMRMKYIGAEKPTPKEVREFFVEYQDSLPVQFNSMRISHLQIPVQPTKQALDSAYVLGKSIIAKLDQGIKFESLVTDFSLDSASVGSGGDIGFFKKGSKDPSYERAAYRLEVGQYSPKPVRTKEGFYILKMLSRRDNEVRTAHIFLPVTPTEGDRLRTLALADSLKADLLADASKFDEYAKKFSIDKKSNQKGGDLGWFTFEELKPQYKSQVQSLDVGQMSEALEIDGHFHILKLTEKKESRKLSLEFDWPMIENYAQNILGNRKMQTFTYKWRKDVYIEVRDDSLAKLYGNSVNTSPVK